MERREEENVGEDNLKNTKEDHTHDIPDPGNSESDETGVTDPAVHATENVTALVSNGKTDDNQNKKDTSQEVPEESDPARYATGHDTIPPKVLVKTDTSKSKQEPDPGSSANVSEQIDNPPTQDATVDDEIRSEAANKAVSPTSSDLGCSPLGPKPRFDQDTRRPADAPHADHKEPVANKKGEVNATQNSDSSSKGTEPKTKEEDEKRNTERGDRDVPDSVQASVPSLYNNTSTSDTSEHSQNLAMQGLQVTQHDIGTSQLEGDEGPEEAAIIQLLIKLYYTKSPEEVPKPNDEAQDTTDLSDEKENTNASECEEMTGNGSSPEHPKPSDEAQDVTDLFEEMTGDGSSSDEKPENEIQVTDRHNRASQREDANTSDTTEFSQTIQPYSSGGPGKTPDMSKETSRTMSTENGSTAQPTTDSSVPKPNDKAQHATDLSNKTENTNASEFAEITGDGSSLEVPKPSDKDQGATDLSDKTENTDASDFEVLTGDGSSSGVPGITQGEQSGMVPSAEYGVEQRSDSLKEEANEDEEPKTEIQVTDHDNWASQPEEGPGPTPDLPEEASRTMSSENGSTTQQTTNSSGEALKLKANEKLLKSNDETPAATGTSINTSDKRGNTDASRSEVNEPMKEPKATEDDNGASQLEGGEEFHDADDTTSRTTSGKTNVSSKNAIIDQANNPGKEKMGVIVHDFDDMRETVQSSRMSSFKYKQPKAFETTSLQITCGHIEKEEQVCKQMRKADRDKIVGFLKHASKYPEEMQKEETKWTESLKSLNSDLKMPSSEDVAQVRQRSYADLSSRSQMSSASGSVVTSVPQRSLSQPTRLTEPRSTAQPSLPIAKRTDLSRSDPAGLTRLTEPRSISVSICSSAYQHNVKGLVSWLTDFKAKHPHMIADVRFRELPYNDIDSFRFPQNDTVDVMVLCHSIQNRGFCITNVMTALYDKYLKYCHDVIGKTKLAVIVHDFTDLKPATAESRMESFRRSQPLTFKLVDTVIICGSLEDQAKLDMTEEDKARLIIFLERARMAPRENSTMSTNRSFVGSLFGFGKS